MWVPPFSCTSFLSHKTCLSQIRKVMRFCLRSMKRGISQAANIFNLLLRETFIHNHWLVFETQALILAHLELLVFVLVSVVGFASSKSLSFHEVLNLLFYIRCFLVVLVRLFVSLKHLIEFLGNEMVGESSPFWLLLILVLWWVYGLETLLATLLKELLIR